MPLLAVFRVKSMLIKTVMQGGLVAAFYEMKKRFNELAQSVGGINWVKCIEVGFEKLLNGELAIEIKIPELADVAMSGGVKRTFELVAGFLQREHFITPRTNIKRRPSVGRTFAVRVGIINTTQDVLHLDDQVVDAVGHSCTIMHGRPDRSGRENSEPSFGGDSATGLNNGQSGENVKLTDGKDEKRGEQNQHAQFQLLQQQQS